MTRRPFRLTLIGLLLMMLLWSHERVSAQTYSPPATFGGAVTIPSSADNNTAQIGVAGSVVLTPINSGPAFGSGICGFAYRNTGESNLDPALVLRCNSYEWETWAGGGSIPWAMVLNSRGLCVGCAVTDTASDAAAYPQAQLDIRARGSNEAVRLWSAGDLYISLNTPDSGKAQCTIFRVAGEPVAAWGRCGNLFGRSLNEINYGKFVGGAWVYVNTMMSW